MLQKGNDGQEYFFGETYRTFGQYVHIETGAKCALILEMLKLAFELYWSATFIGYTDAAGVVHISWALLGLIGCLIGFCQQRHKFFWPLIVLKIVECIVCLCWLATILILGFVGRSMLKHLVRWKFTRLEVHEVATFTLVFFVVVVFLFLTNVAILDVVFRCSRYIRMRAMAVYQEERREIMRNLLV